MVSACASSSYGELLGRETASGLSRESEIMAAAWEEDDALAAELEQEPADVSSEPTIADGESRSVLTGPTEANPLNTVDPFDADDRFAQLPNDPFEEPTEDRIPELDQNQNLEEVEEALDREIERRRTEEEEAPELETEKLPVDENTQRSQIENGTTPQSEFDFPSNEPVGTQPEVVRPLPSQLREQAAEAQESCEEELEALRSDRINSVDLSIRVDGVPGQDFPYECTLGSSQLEPRVWPQITYTWKASALCHKPLYFEQVQLERYGHTTLPDVQPLVSGAHFFGSVAILPYKMGLETPNECIYALGHYRPGSCAPYYIEALPFTWRAAAFQAGAVTGINFALP